MMNFLQSDFTFESYMIYQSRYIYIFNNKFKGGWVKKYDLYIFVWDDVGTENKLVLGTHIPLDNIRRIKCCLIFAYF